MQKFEYMHYRTADKTRGGATVAIYPQDTTKTALIAIARCGPHDVFNKKIGRAIASGRISAFLAGRPSEHVEQIVVENPDDLKMIVDTHLNEFVAEHDLA